MPWLLERGVKVVIARGSGKTVPSDGRIREYLTIARLRAY